MAQVIPEQFMWLSRWFRAPRYLLTLFLGIMQVLAATLGWLGWRLLEQDRALESQRAQEQLDNAADLLGASFLRKFSESEDQLGSLVTLSDTELEKRGAAPLPAERNMKIRQLDNNSTHASGQYLA